MRQTSTRIWNHVLVIGTFLFVLLAGLIFGLWHLQPMGETADAGLAFEEPTALSEVEYKTAVRPMLKPFLEQAVKVDAAELADPSPMLVQLVNKTRESLLRPSLRVPAAAKDAHLSFVLLLDKWQRALTGSAGDQATVVEATQQVITENPWLMQ